MRCPVENGTCHRETEARCPTKDSDGNSYCTLGESSIPVRRGDAFAVYEIKPTPVDGMVKITLSDTQRKCIVLMAERGGEIDFDYGKVEESMRDALRGHLGDLVKMGVVEASPILPYKDFINYHLTTMGRNLASSIMKSRWS